MRWLRKKAAPGSGARGGALSHSTSQTLIDTERELQHASDLCRQGRLSEAEAAYRFILRTSEDNSSALHHLSQLRLKRGDGRTAIELLKRALAVDPRSAQAYCDLGTAFATLNRPEESLEFYQRALAIDPNSAVTHNNLGMALHVVGRLDEAIEAFEKAIALNPEEPESYKNLVLTKRSAPGDPHIDAMQRLAQRMEKLAAVQQITLHFGLGKMYADLQMNEASFRYLLVGNTLQRRQVVYDEGNALRQLDRIRCVYTAELIATRRGHGHPSALPIFIFGMPRSGTTLVEQILASHPAVFGAGELPDLPIRMDGALGGGAIAFPEHVLSVPEDFFNELGARHVERLATLAPAASRVTDKTPTNFRIAGLIHLALPRAHMIHVRRDPVDTCLSCFSLLFGRGLQPQTYDLGELGRYYRAYERLMEHWRMVLPAGAMLEVHYEDIVADLEGQARRLVRYCGLEWDKACLSFHKTQRPVRTASAIQVRQPIYVTSVGRWRPPENVLHPLLVGLGH